jgi:hypothetical protein
MSDMLLNMCELEIWNPLVLMRHVPGSMTQETQRLCRDHHFLTRSASAEVQNFVARNIHEEAEEKSSQCRELVAFIAREYTGGVLLVEKPGERPIGRSCYFWGGPEDVNFVVRLCRALIQTVNAHVGDGQSWSKDQGIEYFKRGILRGMLCTLMTQLKSDTHRHSAVMEVVEQKESLARQRLLKSGFRLLPLNMTRFVAETTSNIAMDLGCAAGSKM